MGISISLDDLSPDTLYIAPSILSADFAALGDDVQGCQAAGAQILHIDIMDGHFVPNLTMGPGIVKCIRPCTNMCYDVHLMITNPSQYIEPFAKAGADNITVHVEIEEDVTDQLRLIHDQGCTAGITLRPATPASALAPYMDQVEMVLVMSVEPGFGGQSFMNDQLDKMREIKAMIKATGRNIHLEVDGGVAEATAPLCKEAGANVLVAGSAVFCHPEGISTGIEVLR